MTQHFKFSKMHGLGNDVLIINNLDQCIHAATLPVMQLADRHVGIGFDQLLVLETSTKAAVYCDIYNADGSQAEQCGNGLRCVARFLHENKFVTDNEFSLETKAGVFPIEIHDYEHIRVSLGNPHIIEKNLLLNLPNTAPLEATLISMGNPHAVIKTADINSIAIEKLSQLVNAQPRFAQGTNIGYLQILDRNRIRLRTYERGVGETFACGSNACAAVVAGVSHGWLNDQVTVELRLGALQIDYNNSQVIMTGPASQVFTGET